MKELLELTVRQKAQQSGRDRNVVFGVVDSTISVDPEYLVRIVTERVDNATKFSRRGTPIHVTSTLQEGKYILSVTDQGQGMSPEQIRTIGAFTQFNRKVHEQQGSGLGLTIAKRLAELHGGTLNIESTPASGTTVTVTLPGHN